MGDLAKTNVQFSCEYYDTNQCDPAKAPCEPMETCKESRGMQVACYAVWANDTNGIKLNLRGCWLAQDAEHNHCNQEKCVTDKPTKSMGDESTYFCCCNKPMCNERFEYVPPSSKSAGLMGREGSQSKTGHDAMAIIVQGFLPLIVIVAVILVVYFIFRRFKLRKEAKRMISLQNNGVAGSPNGSSSPSVPLKAIQLAEMIAKGRFGTVWKGRMGEKNLVAVKVFPAQDVDSWSQEQVIYGAPGLRGHPNILRFMGAEVRGSGVRAEYWLITELQENGSLYAYLKTHTVTLPELYRISVGMLRGLAFLHEESAGGGENSYKPAIVHRDVKSRNVLLNKDLTAMISDFGLAQKCVQGRTPSDVHAQVGTRRYMSPEVLEGATDFNAFAFRQIDVYAAALVLWEILSRCTFIGDVGDYRLPFEDVGLKPSLQEMQDYVVVKKKRPPLKFTWRTHPQGAVICTSIEDMWDTDPEARISAGCALERLSALQENANSTKLHSRISDDCALAGVRETQLERLEGIRSFSNAMDNETNVQADRCPLIMDSRPPIAMETATV